jgi:uncharacterized protein (TIGR00255 family)
MSLRSMTGFGKARGNFNNKNFVIEINSVNSKQFDFNLRCPFSYKSLEQDFRSNVSGIAERGKIDVALSVQNESSDHQMAINEPLALAFLNQLSQLADATGQRKDNLLETVLKLPDVMGNRQQELAEDEKQFMQSLLSQALQEFNNFRESEGKQLQGDLQQRVESIVDLLMQVESFEKERTEIVKTRIQRSLEENIGIEQVDKNRFEQELIYYLERLDITEEKLRLKTHCDYFLSTINEYSSGRKLGFISQEMGREINTLGSKANHAGMQKVVVLMKDELEKIKEQLLNIL